MCFVVSPKRYKQYTNCVRSQIHYTACFIQYAINHVLCPSTEYMYEQIRTVTNILQ